MVVATFTKFQPFVEAMAEKKHNLGSDQLVIALCAAANAPAVANAVLTDLVTITPYANLSSRNITTTSSAQTGGTYKLVLADLDLNASGAVTPFRYVVIYNDTAANDDLIAFWDYGTTVSMTSGEIFRCDFDGSAGVLTLA
jgi:hypothetical protein